MSSRNAIELALRAAPTDEASFLVYADLLQAEGDPRGELITIEHALATADPRTNWNERRATLVAAHPELVPPTPHTVELTWHLGFVQAVTVRMAQPRWLEGLDALFAHPASAYVTRATFEIWMDVRPADLAQLVELLPPTLRAIELGKRVRTDLPRVPLELDSLLRVLPALERLRTTQQVRFQPPGSLRTLELLDGSRETLVWLGATPMPRIESLSLDLTDLAVADLAPVLAADWPALTTLALDSPESGDATIAALIESPLLRQLRTLRVWNAGLTPTGARQLRPHVGHLELLDLSDAGMPDEIAELVAGACRDVRTVPRSARR